MTAIIISFMIYFLIYLAFVIIVRTTGRFHSPKDQIYFFLTGLIFNILILLTGERPMVLTALALYCSLSFATVVLSASPLLAEVSPALIVYLLIKRKAPVSLKTLTVAVAPLLTVNKRLESLMSSGLITRQGNHYRVSWKGNLVHRIISLYRKVMLINVTG